MSNTIIKTIIVEDEYACLKSLLSLIESFNQKGHGFEINIIDSCDTRKKAIQSIKKHKPNLVFLDIEIPNKREGFELLKEIEEIYFDVVFTTAHPTSKYISEFGEVNVLLGTSPFKWLNKPIELDDLENQVLELVQNWSSNHQELLQKSGKLFSENLGKDLSDQYIQIIGNKSKNELLITDNGTMANSPLSIKSIPLMNVLYIEPDENYCDLHYLDDDEKKKYVIRITLNEVAKSLQNAQFFRVHRSYVVNLKKVESYDKNFRKIYLKGNEDPIPVGGSRVDELKKLLAELGM